MPAICIDANIWLGFWRLREGRLPSELLLPLVELGDHLLLTRQVADEVERNKLTVFLKNAGEMSSRLPPSDCPMQASLLFDAAVHQEIDNAGLFLGIYLRDQKDARPDRVDNRLRSGRANNLNQFPDVESRFLDGPLFGLTWHHIRILCAPEE